MTDGHGHTVDFAKTLIVMTSNLDSQMIQQMSDDDYQVFKLAVMAEVKTNFRPDHTIKKRALRREPVQGSNSGWLMPARN